LDNSKRKVLIIDDEAHIRRLIAFKLEKRGYEVMTAMNGEEGLNLIQTERPQVVISDIMMPKLDGKSLCEKTNDLKTEWPFLTIIMTCSISHDERLWIQGMRDTLFMEKPFSPAILLEHVDGYFCTQV
jgi:DNA-binding response OmpR family regulator